MQSRSFRSALVGLLFALLAPAWAVAQATGRIEGRVVDAATGQPLPGAAVAVQGSQVGANTGADGRFVLARVPAGARQLTATLGAYAASTQRVDVPAAGVARVEFRLTSETFAIGAVVATGTRRREGLSQALEAQRAATGVVSNLSQEQISRSPDSDAAAAVQRVSGVTLQDNKFVFVRGLGERYSQTSLNGARVPSPEPDRKVVPLDLFPASVLEGISVAKTFTPDLPGDFSGAQVNLRTRGFPSRRTASFSFSAGMNSAASFQDVLAAPTEGPEWFGYPGGARGLPAQLTGGLPADDAGQAAALTSLRDAWSAEEITGRPNVSMVGTFGGQGDFLNRPLGYIASLSYSASQEIRKDERRAVASGGGVGTGVRAINDFRGETGRHSVLWGGILNLSLQTGEGSRILFNNTYDRTSDNEAVRLGGVSEELGAPVDVTRLSFVQRSVYASQLGGDHILGGRHRLDWFVTLSGVARNEPDRSDLVYQQVGSRYLWADVSRGATRSFDELSENSVNAEANYTLRFGDDVGAASLKLGGMFRATGRDASLRAYDIFNRNLTEDERSRTPEEIFGGDHAGRLLLRENTFGGSYTADETLGAGYLMADLPLRANLRLVGGARVEYDNLEVSATDVLNRDVDGTLENTDVLPAVALNWEPTDWQKVRLSATQTLSRPEYRELAGITYFEQFGGVLIDGNPRLERALVRNFDLRWELYPSAEEFFAVALFAKDFDRPIERVYSQSTGRPRVTFVNTESAFNYGVELEARKGLSFLAERFSPLSVFANATLVRSEITIGDESLALTNDSRPMTGQAPYVVNAGLTYAAGEGRRTATLLYNVVGERIVEVGAAGIPDAYEQPRHVVDFSVQWPLLRSATLKLDAENLLDAPYEVTQGSVTRLRYTSGRTVSLGVTVRQ
jgi:outer membrane receptor protein involved in Fe transport